MVLNWNALEEIIIIGGGHGIGLGLTGEILERARAARVTATYRRAEKANDLITLAQRQKKLAAVALDPTDELAVDDFALQWRKGKTGNLHLLINCVGLLHNGELQPEKSLGQINIDLLTEIFRVNTFVTPLLAKYFFRDFRHHDQAVFAALSAKVGSISDNRMGGWYGYRALKAALNMFIKNIAIEYANRGCSAKVLAIHPGTTVTALSKPFIQKTSLQLHTPDETASNILNVIEGADESGVFLSWDGSTIPW